MPTFLNTLSVPSSSSLAGGTCRPTKMEQTECSETSAYKVQTPGNHPEESIQHSEHGESLKSRREDLPTDRYSRTRRKKPKN